MRQEKTDIENPQKHSRHPRYDVTEIFWHGNEEEQKDEDSDGHSSKNHLSLTHIGHKGKEESKAQPGDFLPQSSLWKGESVEFNESLSCGGKNEKEKSNLLTEKDDDKNERTAYKACQYSLENRPYLVVLWESSPECCRLTVETQPSCSLVRPNRLSRDW